MKIEINTQKKTIKTLSGAEVERTANVKTVVFETPADITALLGDRLVEYAAAGYKAIVRQKVANQMVGGSNTELKSEIRDFKAKLANLLDMKVEIGLDDEQCLAATMRKASPALKAFIEASESATTSFEFDFTANLPAYDPYVVETPAAE